MPKHQILTTRLILGPYHKRSTIAPLIFHYFDSRLGLFFFSLNFSFLLNISIPAATNHKEEEEEHFSKVFFMTLELGLAAINV